MLAPLLKDSKILELLLPNGTSTVEPVVAEQTASPFMMVVAGIITVTMILISLVVLWRLPKKILKAGNTVSYGITESVLPIATHHKKLPKKKQLVLTKRIVLLVRLAFIVVPLVALVFSPTLKDLSSGLVWLVGASLATISIVSLMLEKLFLVVSVKTFQNKK